MGVRDEERARNSVRGRTAKAAGDMLEDYLATQHLIARQIGVLAHIDKIDPPAKVHGGRVEFGEKTVSDYVGMLSPAPLTCQMGANDYPPSFWGLLEAVSVSRYVAVEAKSTQKYYLPRAEITPKQQAHLDVISRGRGLALLVVEYRYQIEADSGALSFFTSAFGLIRRYAVPWNKIEWGRLKTAESVTEATLLRGGWRIEDGKCYLERFHPRGAVINPPVGRVYPKD